MQYMLIITLDEHSRPRARRARLRRDMQAWRLHPRDHAERRAGERREPPADDARRPP